jgi:recombination protein RecT
MANPKEIKNALKTQGKDDKPKTIKQWIAEQRPDIEAALPNGISPERFSRMAMTAVLMNPALSKCTSISFMGALMQAAQLGLEPNTPLGQAYLIPYGNKVQFQLGYKGLIDLAYRSGEFQAIDAEIVYENDLFEFEYGLNADLKHIPAMKDRGQPVYAYGLFKLKNGGFGFKVMGYDEVVAHGKRFSKTFAKGPWTTDEAEMVKKTILKKVLKYAPIKVELVREIATDKSIKDELNKDMTEVPSENIFDDDIQIIEDEPEVTEKEIDEVFPK